MDNTGNEKEDREKKIQPELHPETNRQDGGHRRQEDREDDAEDVHDAIQPIKSGQSIRMIDILQLLPDTGNSKSDTGLGRSTTSRAAWRPMEHLPVAWVIPRCPGDAPT